MRVDLEKWQVLLKHPGEESKEAKLHYENAM